MPTRRTKLYPSHDNYQRTEATEQRLLPWLAYVNDLVSQLKPAEKESATVVASIAIWYEKEVSQAEIDARKLALIEQAVNGLRPDEGMSAEQIANLKRALASV